MSLNNNLSWFKEAISNLKEYKVDYKHFENGDFGALTQIEFNSELKGGNVDFWSTGWVGIHLVNYSEGNELINLLLEPTENEQIYENLKKLINIL
jgi:hypothetical protein